MLAANAVLFLSLLMLVSLGLADYVVPALSLILSLLLAAQSIPSCLLLQSKGLVIAARFVTILYLLQLL